jgi:hypothetical protein
MNGGSGGGNFIATGSISASVSLGTGSFTVTSGSSTFMFVSSSGNVGIGTTTPITTLSVTGTETSGRTIQIRSSAGKPFVEFFTSVSIGVIGSAVAVTGGSANDYGLGTNGNSTANIVFGTGAGYSERMRIFGSTGNIAINTTTDAGFKLDVNGTLRSQGTLTVGAGGQGQITAGTLFLQYPGALQYASAYGLNIDGTTTGNGSITINGSYIRFLPTNHGLEFTTNTGTKTFLIQKQQGGADSTSYLDISGADQTSTAYLGKGGPVRIYGGLNNGIAEQGFVVLAHNGTTTRGAVVVGGISAHTSSIFDIQSTTRGFLPPRTNLTSNISSPAQGLITYVTASATEGLYYYNSGSLTGWHKVLSNSGSQDISGSLNVTSFTASNATISGNVTVLGTASINTLVVNQTQFTSGSNQLGDAADDFQTLYGTVRIPTGSLTVSGALAVTSSATIQTLTIGLGAGSIAFNTALGFQALRVNTTGEANVGVGYRTFYNNTSGGYSVAVGYQSLYNNLGGNNNSAIGWYSLYNNTNGSGNTAIGLSSLQANTTGNSNTALGRQSLFTNTTGSNITAIGHSSLRSNLANNNTAVGYESAYSNTTGAQITAVGNAALRSNTLGSNNSAFGEGALYFNTLGNNNVSLGAYSLFRNISGSNNTSVGDTSLGFTTSNNNVALGYLAGNSNTSGANNIFIGANSTGVSATESNRTWIGNSSTTSTWLAGNVLINTTTDAGYKLDVNGTARSTDFRLTDNTLIAAAYTIGGTSLTISNTGHNNATGISVTSAVGIRAYSNLGVSGNNILGASIYAAGGSSGGNISLGLLSNRALITNTASGLSMHTSSMLQVDSTTQGFLPPRTNLTSNISSPARGLMTYITASANEGLYYYNSGSTPGWRQVADTTFVSASLSGSAGYLPVFTGANSVSSSVIFQSGSNVGIGTVTPTSPLDVSGSARVSGRFENYIVGAGTPFLSGNSGIGAVRIGIYTDNSSYASVYTEGSHDLRFGTGGSVGNLANVVVFKDSNKSLGIGVTPSARIQVRGAGATSSTTSLLVENSNTSASLAVLDNSNVGIGTTTATYRLSVLAPNAGDGIAAYVGSAAMIMTGNAGSGNPGIGSTSGVIHVNATLNGTGGNEVLNVNKSANGAYIQAWRSFANAPLSLVDGNGNFAIRRTSATASLDVAGTTRLSGSFNTAASGSILTVIGSGSAQPIFTVQGSQGELFSITDSLSGSLFSVNDISGLPILEVFSDNTTLIGNYQDPMLLTTTKVVQTNSGSFTVYSLPTASYDTAFFEYSIRSGSNARAGTIMAIQSGSAVNFTETTTTDFGSTSAVSFTVIVTGSNMALTGSSTSGAWTIKTIVRGL